MAGSLPQNVKYALKGSMVTVFIESLPEVSAKLAAPRPANDRPLSEVAAEVKEPIVLVAGMARISHCSRNGSYG